MGHRTGKAKAGTRARAGERGRTARITPPRGTAGAGSLGTPNNRAHSGRRALIYMDHAHAHAHAGRGGAIATHVKFFFLLN